MARKNGKKHAPVLGWVDIIGYEGLYQISVDGFVRSMPRVIVGKNGHSRKMKMRLSTAFINTSGYLSVGLSKNKKQKQWLLHRLLAIHFIPNPENKPYINHINAIRDDARLENLEWCTQSENNKHAFKIGRCDIHGERHPIAKLTNKDVLKIRESCKTHNDAMKYANKLNVSISTIKDVIWRRTWTHI